MNQSHDPNDDELRDRLLEQALREVLHKETPPDLSGRILSVLDHDQVVLSGTDQHVAKPKTRRFRLSLTEFAVASVIVGLLFALLLPALHAPRKAALRMQAQQRIRQRGMADHQRLPSPYYLHDDVGYLPEGALPFAENVLPDRTRPGQNGDRYERSLDSPFCFVRESPLSTFSIDVDTASYANVRRFLVQDGQLPPAEAVRIEELINYFDYHYEVPGDEVPFAAQLEVAECPWYSRHQLVRIGLQGRTINPQKSPPCNLVFLLDVSGSMDSPDKLPLLKRGMKLLVQQLRDEDRVAIVVYASSEGLALRSTPGTERSAILAALENLQAGGSTAGGAGIELAYRIAQENFVPHGVNRVLLCTDGDFNVGVTDTTALEQLVAQRAKAGVFLSVLGFGRGNLNDAMMEEISNKGNGNYFYIDGITEAHKVLVQQVHGTLVTIAKDVKIQVEFNPATVSAYRLIGYENRVLAAEDFNDDKKDAGEIGAGHSVTALYEIIPVMTDHEMPVVDPLKYQPDRLTAESDLSRQELLTLKIRYKEPEADESKRLVFPLSDSGTSFEQASTDFQFAAAVASFGMLLRHSSYKGNATYESTLEMAAAAKGPDEQGYRAELLDLIRRAQLLTQDPSSAQ